MSTQVNNVAATADWQTLPAPATRRLRISVANGAIWLQRARAQVPGGAPEWGDEAPTQLLPQVASYDAQCDAVRFKYVAAPAAGAEPPRVTIDALTEDEL